MAPETRATAGEKAAGTLPVVAEEGVAAVEAQVVPAMADIGTHTAEETGPGVVPVHVVVDEVGSGAVAATRVKAEAGRAAEVKAAGSPLAVGTEELGRVLAEAATRKHAAADPGARAVAVAAQEGRGPMTVSSDKVGDTMPEAEEDQGARAAAAAAQDGKVGEPMTEAAAERFWMIPQHGVKSIALKSNDDRYFFVPEDFARPFKTIYAILEFGRGDSDADMIFPLPNVDGRTLSIALEWQASVESGDVIELGRVDGLEVKDFYSLMYAGEYLEHEELVKAACSAVAYRMCDKTTDQIRETASFARCFPDLYETIRHELTSTWAKGRPMF